jgi:hypothetical protein
MNIFSQFEEWWRHNKRDLIQWLLILAGVIALLVVAAEILKQSLENSH